MKKAFYPELLWVLCALAAAGIGWLLVRRGATPNGRVAVEQVLREITPPDVESLTVYPLVAGAGPARPFQVRDVARLRRLVPALRALRPVAASAGPAFQPLLEATLMVRLAAAPAEAWQLHSRTLIFRLAASSEGEVAQLAQTNYFYHAAALSQQLWQLRDSLARSR
ncbi:hypothetical protein [Hymenobacter bucti]|uniref:DUF1499 domain-containing protein n=1 Tax=Hymenobacter bucti TaxID=1844114 RepID=A0ABW4QZB6_9BACT